MTPTLPVTYSTLAAGPLSALISKRFGWHDVQCHLLLRGVEPRRAGDPVLDGIGPGDDGGRRRRRDRWEHRHRLFVHGACLSQTAHDGEAAGVDGRAADARGGGIDDDEQDLGSPGHSVHAGNFPAGPDITGLRASFND